jgi:hypothetical protein
MYFISMTNKRGCTIEGRKNMNFRGRPVTACPWEMSRSGDFYVLTDTPFKHTAT